MQDLLELLFQSTVNWVNLDTSQSMKGTNIYAKSYSVPAALNKHLIIQLWRYRCIQLFYGSMFGFPSLRNTLTKTVEIERMN